MEIEPDPSLQWRLSVHTPAQGHTPDPALTLAQLQAENRALREDNARIHQVIDSAVEYAIITLDGEGCITDWNAGAQNILGYTAAEAVGRSGDILFTAEDRREGRFTKELRRARETGQANNERWHLRRDGTRFWASGLMMPLLGTAGEADGFLNIMRDRSDVQAQAEQRELLMAELTHRVKNTFTMVQAVASQSCRHAQNLVDFQAVFASRLAALARSHDILIQGKWEAAPLRGVIEGALATLGSEPGRVIVEGAPVVLPANLVVILTLVFHELATNAAKYGALLVPEGVVHVTWAIGRAAGKRRHVKLRWRERGGPPMRQPQRKGFGTYLMGRGLGQVGASLRVDFQPSGLECHIGFPLGAEGGPG